MAKPRSILKKTLFYVLGFGLGSLAIAAVLSFALMSIAEGVLPSGDGKAPKAAAPKIIGAPQPGAKKGPKIDRPKPVSKQRRPRGNQPSGANKKGADQPL